MKDAANYELQKPNQSPDNGANKVKKLQENKTLEKGEALPVFLGLCAFIIVIGIILGASWLAQGNDFFLYKVFAPKYEQVRHDTFKNSQAYNDGMLQELRHSQLEYEKADDAHKAALGSIILHQYASYDRDRLPSDLRTFLDKLQREQSLK